LVLHTANRSVVADRVLQVAERPDWLSQHQHRRRRVLPCPRRHPQTFYPKRIQCPDERGKKLNFNKNN
jgi:hypothetical protein